MGVWYLLKKHWLANNLLGLAFAVNGVELLHLNNVVTGCILLGTISIQKLMSTYCLMLKSSLQSRFQLTATPMDGTNTPKA